MLNRHRLAVAGATVILMAGLGACGGGADAPPGRGGTPHGSGNAAPGARPRTDTVTGLRDGVRHILRKTVTATRPHMVRRCTTATERVRHTKRTGTGAGRKTRTWYTTERYQHCTRVRQGTETYRRVVRPERWCVSLDDVDGRTGEDDVWYRVTRVTYDKALATDRHSRMEITPTGTGC